MLNSNDFLINNQTICDIYQNVYRNIWEEKKKQQRQNKNWMLKHLLTTEKCL